MNVVFIIYNRPEMTRRVFAEIAKARPSHLFVIADGPCHEADKAKCSATRSVVDSVDWPCSLKTEFADANMGCRKRVLSGLDWVFQHVDRAIILEDDCIPSQGFFWFCDELLERYKDDLRIGHIAGSNFLDKSYPFFDEYSYYFSRYSSIWGWATWRRMWLKMDKDMTLWPELKKAKLHYDLFSSRDEALYFEQMWDDNSNGIINAWSPSWFFNALTHATMTIVPRVNMISNIGFGANATHTKDAGHVFANLIRQDMPAPLIHPPCVIRNDNADRDYAERGFLKEWRIFLRKRFGGRFKNKYFYARILRSIPLVRDIWIWSVAEWRRLCFKFSLAVAYCFGLDGVRFGLFGLSISKYCKQKGCRTMGRELSITPVHCIRYFEFNFVADVAKGYSHSRCLDVSSPRLYSAYTLNKYKGVHVDIVNPDKDDLDQTAQLFDCLNMQKDAFQLHHKKAQELEMGNEVFDVIWAISVIEHIPEPQDIESIKNLWRMLKVGGLLVLTLPVKKEAENEYRKRNVYNQQDNIISTKNQYFFQRWYDETELENRILAQVSGGRVIKKSLFAEKQSGWFSDYEKSWQAHGESVTCVDPLLMAMHFKEFDLLDDIPGCGVIGLALKKVLSV